MALSIEFRTGFVYLVEARTTRTYVSVKKVHAFSFPPDWVTESGVLNLEDMASLLKQQIKEQKIKQKRVTICLNNSSVINRELSIPKVDKKRIPLIVHSEMMSALNLTPNYITDFVVLDEFEKDEAMYYKVLASSISDSAMESYLELMKRCKLTVDVVDSGVNAVLKYIDESEILGQHPNIMVVDIGNGHLRSYLFNHGEFVLARNNRIVAYSDSRKEEIQKAVVENIHKIVQFYSGQFSQQALDAIYLTGLDEILESVCEEVRINLNIQCDTLKKPTMIEAGNKFEHRYINALGALIRR